MKNCIFTIALCFLISFNFAQGILSDIMSVETVHLNLNEVHDKQFNKYQETLAKEKSDMEDDIASLDKKYQDNVADFVDDFTKQLKNGEEKIVARTKAITVSRVISLTMGHRTDKKNIVQHFLNEMQLANRKLPDFLREEAAIEVKSIGAVHFATLEDDYEAHMATIKDFEDQEHLIVIDNSAL